MEQFNLVKDSKYTTWWRDYYTIEAESLEEAIKIATDEYTYEAIYSEEIDECLENMTIEQNQGNCTVEVFDSHDKPFMNAIWNNVKLFNTDKDE